MAGHTPQTRGGGDNPSRTERVIARLPELFELWDDFYEAETPVRQADTLLTFSNAITHLRWEHDGELDHGDHDE